MSGIEYTKDTGFSIDASGVTWQRKMMLFGDSLIDILNSIKLPQHGSRHPGNSLLRLTSSTCNEVGNLNGKCQALWEGTYTTSSSGFSYQNEKDPWELAAQNLTTTPFSIREAMTEYYDGFDHKKHDGAPTNTAGDAFEIEQELFGTEYSFIFCVKAKNKEPELNRKPLLNSREIRIAGVSFEAYDALLMPMQYRHIKDSDSKGRERSYYEISVTIKEHPHGWLRTLENVGVLARPAKDEPSEPIYRYTPWVSENLAENIKVKPKFGTLANVIEAKHKYANIISPDGNKAGGDAATKYWNAWQELPYQEVTEPMYLDQDGCLEEEGYANNLFGAEVNFYEYDSADFSQYGLPDKKEG